jgi:hypothetical protein
VEFVHELETNIGGGCHGLRRGYPFMEQTLWEFVVFMTHDA